MSFNPDPTKQAAVMTFSRKKKPPDHPSILFSDTPVLKVEDRKDLGFVLDSTLAFSSHIKSAVSRSRRGIEFIKFLSNYLPRHTLNELYKLYVRPHLDYGDFIYHIPPTKCGYSEDLKLNHQMEKLESVQYSAALAVTGAWKCTFRDKLYEELGWELLNLRRWSRRLVLFFKIVNNRAPENTREPIPPLPQSYYSLRRPAIIGQIRARTKSFGASFYPNCLSEWNKLDPEIRQSSTLGIFKKKLFKLSRPIPPPSLQHSRPERLSNSNTTSCGFKQAKSSIICT